MRIFFFTPQLPYPPHSGGRIVTASLLDRLCCSHEITLFTLGHGSSDESQGLEMARSRLAEVVIEPGHGRLSLLPLLRSAASRNPYKVHRFRNQRLISAAKQRAAQKPVDVVHCQNFYMAEYVRHVPARRALLYQENFETLILERWRETTSNPLLAKLIETERRRTLKYELACLNWFDQLLTISVCDQQRYRSAAQSAGLSDDLIERIQCVPPAIDLEAYGPEVCADTPSPFPDDERLNLVFTGTFSYTANEQGALWLVREVLPFLSQESYRVWLVGNHPSELVQQLHDPPQVVVTGGVPDVQPYLYHAQAALVPLQIGGGIRLKILEALAMGCPVVSTPVGCEGLAAPGEATPWLEASRGEEFAQAVVRLTQHPVDRHQQYQWVAERYSPERFARDMESHYR